MIYYFRKLEKNMKWILLIINPQFVLESLLSLTERLIGPFNLEMTIDPISIKISDAIMNFQESGFQVILTILFLGLTWRGGGEWSGKRMMKGEIKDLKQTEKGRI